MKLYRNQRPIAECKNKLVTYSKNSLYYKSGEEFVRICKLYNGRKALLSKVRFFERLLRISPRCGIDLDEENLLISLNGGVSRVNIINGEATLEHSYRNGMKHPLSFTKLKNIDGFADAIVYGEYWNNESRESVSIYRRKEDNSKVKWENVYTFKEKTIKHIHNIITDSNNSCVYILTGDLDAEAGIWKATRDFKHVEKVLVGRQMYRTCFLSPTKDGFIYITDCPDKWNYIYYYNINKKNINRIMEIDGSCLSGLTLRDGSILFSTAVEPNEKTMRFYLLNNKRGDGIKDGFSHVYLGSQDKGWKEILNSEKDILPMSLFQLGGFSFMQTRSGVIYGYGTAVKKFDNCMFEFSHID